MAVVILAGLALATIPRAAAAREVVDLAGRHVTVPDHPQRVLLGEGRFVFAMAILDRDDPVKRVVGWQGELKAQDPYAWQQLVTRYPAAAKVPLIGQRSESSVSPEKIVSLRPDVAIFGLSGHGPGVNNPMIKPLQDAGIPIVFIDFREHPVEHTVASMRVLGQVLDREKAAQAYVDFYEDGLRRVRAVVDPVPLEQRPRVFVEMLAGVWPACCHSTGKGNFGDLVVAAGGRNVAADVLPGAIGDVSLEYLMQARPDVYVATGSRSDPLKPGLLAGPGIVADVSARSLSKVLAREGIRDLDAVRRGRTLGIWHAYYNSPYNIIAIEALARLFYPRAGATLDPETDMARLYRDFVRLDPNGTYWTAAAGPAAAPAAPATSAAAGSIEAPVAPANAAR
ncbi:ABC transporter substrate-binding protein [Bordetella sp. N]|uniref:ABC transporter substrate-binding protein n=1 Tax=Bordetella sp. N TaxID=1746199 RepID=UPI000ADECC1A|nr:ABC transporter substrate-binding protein [Bordetella sp. N]